MKNDSHALNFLPFFSANERKGKKEEKEERKGTRGEEKVRKKKDTKIKLIKSRIIVNAFIFLPLSIQFFHSQSG